jgi:hypothetical protein
MPRLRYFKPWQDGVGPEKSIKIDFFQKIAGLIVHYSKPINPTEYSIKG